MIELILTLFLLVTEYPIASGMVLLIIAFLVAGLGLWYGDKCYDEGRDDFERESKQEIEILRETCRQAVARYDALVSLASAHGHELDHPERNKNDGTDWP